MNQLETARVDERIPATPAVRVRVHVARLAQQAPLGLQELRQRLVRVAPEQARDIRDRRQEPAAVVEREDHRDAGRFADLLVLLAVCGSLVHDAGAVVGGDVVGHEDLPRVRQPVVLDVGVVLEEPVVGDAIELCAAHGAAHGRAGVVGGVVPEVFRIAGDEVGREQVLGTEHLGVGCPVAGLLAQDRGVGGAVRPGGHDGVLDVGSDGQREVRGKGPRRGGPRERSHGGEAEGFGLRAREREGDRHRLVLHVLVDVVVHAQLVVRERRLVAPAVRQHPVALVGEALVVQRLEGPDDRFHERDVERLVVVLEVDPACLPGHVLLPLLRVAEHRVAGGLVEGRDAHLLDLALVGDAELALRLELGGQAVRVPAEAAVHLVAAHRLEAREEVLRVPGEQVAVVRQAVRERRAVVEDPLGCALALVDRRLEGAVLLPEREHLALEGGEVG